MTSLRCFGLAVVSLLVPTLLASLAHAEPFTCDVTDDGSRFCVDVITCTGDDACFIGDGTEDWYCSPPSSVRPGSRECLAACTTMFGCGSTVDCPGGPAGTFAVCQRTTTAPGVCTYRGSAPANQRITYCSDALSPVLDHFLGACHTLPGVGGHTPDYYLGDCDGDGCANGADDEPCAAPDDGLLCGIMGLAATSPFCPPLPTLACAPTAGGLECGAARPCSPEGVPCEGPTACEAGWSDVDRCRPPCGSLFLCEVRSGLASGACPQFDGQPGVCLPLPAPFPSYPDYDGVCAYGFFDDASCAPDSFSSDCLVDPSSSLTANFFKGDCDRDGIANGCDSMRCTPGGASDTCVDVPGVGCSPTPPPPDAGAVDGGGANIDGGTATDAATGTDGGGAASDSGNASFDAGASAGDASGGSFSGGGGCRCSAAGSDHGGRIGLTLALLALALVVKRRRG